MTINFDKIYKSFKGQEVLKNLCLSIPDKSIFFLLGLNGAGKTTLMKIALGLVTPDEGDVKYDVENEESGVGALIETPTFYTNMTAYQNLMHYAILTGAEHKDIVEAMELVGLDWQNKKKVKKYSLGMCQRLGLARAIIAHPHFLILDEPLNGLDPLGIECIKKLILKLNKEKGMTIFLSSHLIRETENLATHYAIINEGRIVIQFKAEDVEKVTKCIVIKFDDENREEFFDKYNKQLHEFIVYEKDGVYKLIGKSVIQDEAKFESFFNDILTFDKFTEKPLMSNVSLNELFFAYTERSDKNVVYN